MQKKANTEKNFIGVKEILSPFTMFNQLLYSFLNLFVGPLSVYVCALNRTFLIVGWSACLVRT